MSKARDYFKYYLFGYLNVYYTDLGLHNNDKKLFKDQRKMDVIHYLHLRGLSEKLFVTFSPLISTLEPLFSIVVLFYLLLLVLLKYPFCQNYVRNERHHIIYGAKRNLDKFYNLIECAKIDKDKLVIIAPPYGSICYEEEYKVDSLLSGISILEILKSFMASFRMVFYMTSRYRKHDCFFRAYSSFEFFMMCYFFERCNNVVYHAALIDRKAFLYGHLNNRVIFLQHGKIPEIEDSRFLIKSGKADEGYFIDAHQMELCCSQLFTNMPLAHYLASFSFTSNHKLVKNGKKNILLVCNHLFFEKEKEIIVYLSKCDNVNLYVKPHPNDEPSLYRNLLPANGILLEKSDFPHVDTVVSYDSTLALEYSNAGVDVIYHDKSNYQEDLKRIIE